VLKRNLEETRGEKRRLAMKMSRTFAAVVVLSLSGAAAAWSQMTPSTQSQPAPMDKPAAQSAAPEAKEIQGTIKNVDRTKKTLTLEDGTTLAIPASVMVSPDSLKKGARVRATYEEQGSQKVVTSLHVEPPSKS
jgi:Cu/Ag efflux protein CusF